MSSKIIQEDRIHSGPQVNNEWDSCESEEDRGDLTSSSPKTRGACAARQGALTKALSSWGWRSHVLQRGWVGAGGTKGCSSPGAGKCSPTAGGLCQHIKDQHSLEPCATPAAQFPPVNAVLSCSFHLSVSSSLRTRQEFSNLEQTSSAMSSGVLPLDKEL